MKNKNQSSRTSDPQRSQRKKKTVNSPPNRETGLTIVGIGASAGGLKALRSFFKALPDTTGMAFVVITHLHPEHESHLADILQGDTKMRVSQVTSKVDVKPDHVYVIPPNHQILMTDHQLDVQEFDEPRGLRTPVDHFFRSLAKAHHEIVGIILSGGGTDGSVGIKAIKEEGGLLMAQSPEEAEYDGMPRAAIATGIIDAVLPVSELAATLIKYARHPSVLPHDPDDLSAHQLETMQGILANVNARTGHDFRRYKRGTILRRIQRRMQLSGHESLEEYQNYMRQNSNEATAMFNDILIGVTNFFRDAKSWDLLAKTVIPALFADKHEGDSIRVWTIGCSTGEEAYTLGILLQEHAATLSERIPIQVFASDLDDRALAQAREGIYPSAIEADVSPARLEKFFTPHDSHYQVKRELRDIVLFTKHSVLRDPPFSKLDLISCRNLLIYLQRDVHEMVLDTFHYSLIPEGYLFLGSSESAESVKELFHAVDKSHRIYKAKPWAGKHPHVPTLPLKGMPAPSADAVIPLRGKQKRFVSGMPAIEDHLKALESFGPASIWVDEDYLILNISESAGRYLLYPGGPVTNDLLKVVRPELQMELRTALFQAFEKGKSIVSTPLSVDFNGKIERAVISVQPDPRNEELKGEHSRKALVNFMKDESRSGEELQESTKENPVQQGDEMMQQLEGEVHHLRSRLQATQEEFNSSNEEMKAANEELQSINEEYRSTMEELETSKEELQSVNEELQTVNNELRNSVEEISRAHSDLENLMDATQIATLFLDRDLKIKRYSPGVEQLFNIRSTDRGRPISDFTRKIGYQDLVDDARTVLETLTVIERESTSTDNGSMLIRLLPYRTLDKRVDGVVISFVDITEVKNVERIRQNYQSFYTLFHGSPVPTMLTRRDDNRIMDVNVAFLNYLVLGREAVIEHQVDEFNLGLDMESNESDFADKTMQNFETEWVLPSGERRSILTFVQPLHIQKTEAILYTFVDITERVKAELEIRRLNVERKTIEHQERQRIAQILHDDLQQRLFAIKIHLQEALQDESRQSANMDLAKPVEWLAEAITMTRQLGADLSPLSLREGKLEEGILSLASQMKDLYGLEVELMDTDFEHQFDEALLITLLHSVRELLFNIVKHSGTLKATVTLEQVNRDWVHIRVRDEGKGFDSKAILSEKNRGRGLRSLQQDLKLFGGHLEVESGENGGTRIIISIPIRNSESRS